MIETFQAGYEITLKFDGFLFRCNDNINDGILNECRLHALGKTGYDILLKIKPFDCNLELPDDYTDENYNFLQSVLIDKNMALTTLLKT